MNPTTCISEGTGPYNLWHNDNCGAAGAVKDERLLGRDGPAEKSLSRRAEESRPRHELVVMDFESWNTHKMTPIAAHQR